MLQIPMEDLSDNESAAVLCCEAVLTIAIGSPGRVHCIIPLHCTVACRCIGIMTLRGIVETRIILLKCMRLKSLFRDRKVTQSRRLFVGASRKIMALRQLRRRKIAAHSD